MPHSFINKTRLLVATLLFTVLSACSVVNSDATLYQRLGGAVGVENITELFILEIARDERVITYFEDSNVQRFREKFVEHLCMITDGPCEYTGDTMIDIHVGMDVTEGAFTAIVEDLIEAMKKADVAIGLQNQVLDRLAGLRGEIIYR
ncbi:MAG: group I truncated hemoglobin [Gammaproteobacteria bacterium]